MVAGLMRGTGRIMVIAGVVLVLIAPGFGVAAAAPPAQDWEDAVGTLEVTAGSATVTFAGGSTDPLDLPTGDFAPVGVGDQVAVSDDGEAILTFFEGAETRITAGTTIEVDQFETSGESVRIGFSVLAGQTLSAVDATLDAESRFEVNTPAASITVRGTEFVVFVRENQLMQVATLDGTVTVAKGDQTADVYCGYGLKVAPEDEALGEVKVWGQLVLELAAPVEDTSGIPVTMVNNTLEQTFRYRTGDRMFSVVLGGPYDVTLHTPGPVRLTDLVFPEDTEAMQMEVVPVVLGALDVLVVDDVGAPVEVGDLLVTLSRDDLSNTTLAAAGDPLLADPGSWTVEIALADNPEQTFVQPVNIPHNDTVTLSVPLSALEG